MKKKFVRKTLSVCMVITLLFSTTTAISATGIDETSLAAVTEKTSLAPSPLTVDGVTPIVGEQEALRGEYEKHFLMPDGTLVAAVYDVPVHYLNEQTGEWNEIDNTLQAAVDVNGDAVYRNRDGLFDVSFAQSATTSEPLVTLQTDGHSIAWHFVQPTSGSGGLEVMSTSEQAMSLTALPSAQVLANEPTDVPTGTVDASARKTTGTVLYEDLAGQNTDVRLTVTPVKVKEDILLTAVPTQAVSYTTRLALSEGLTPVLGEDGTVFIRDAKGVDVFRIAAPYMTDAMDELSQDVDVDLLFVGGAWELTVTPDMDWLTDTARVYPVTIDPTVYAANNASNTWDTYIYQNCTSGDAVSRQDLDRMYIGNRTSASQLKCRGLVKFLTMPKIYGNITSAQLSFTTPSGTTSWKNMTLYRITESWNCSTLAWPGPAATAIQSKAVSNGKYTFDVTAAIRAMYHNNSTGTAGNYGFQIRYQDETASDYNSLRSSEWSTDTANDAAKPYLAITYTNYSPCSFTSGELYHITNVASGNYLSVTNFGSTGTILSGQTPTYQGNQSWKLIHEGNGVYSATPAFRIALRMNVPGITNGQDVNVISSNNSDAQRWVILPNSDGTYRFMPVSGKDDAKVLQVENATAGSVSSAEIGVWSGAAKQKWKIQDISSPAHSGVVSGKTYYIKNVSTGKYLGMVSDTNATLVQVGQGAKVQNGRQRWRITYSGGNYTLQPIIAHDGIFNLNKSLEIPNGNIYPDAVPQINTSHAGRKQKFQLKQLNATTFAFLTNCSGYNTTLTAGSGTAVATSYYSGGATQQWVLEPAFDATQTAISLGGELFWDATDEYEQYAEVKESSRVFGLMGYEASYDADMLPGDFNSLIDGKNVAHFSCHGGPDRLQFKNRATAAPGDLINISTYYGETLEENGVVMANIPIFEFDISDYKLMIFDACSTYVPGGYEDGLECYDICDMVVDFGVDAVIAWGHVTDSASREWLQQFFNRSMRGDTIQQAVDYMNTVHCIDEDTGKCICGDDICCMYDAKVVGNGNFRLFAQQ